VRRATRNLWISILFVLALVAGSVAAFVLGTRPVLGLDLEGGVSVVLSAPPGTDQATMQQALENIRTRVDAFGVGEPLLYQSGTNIEVQLPGLARGTIDPRAKDQYRLVDGEQKPWATYASKDAAEKALSDLTIAPGAQQFCLTGAVFGKTPPTPCPTTNKAAQQTMKAITVVPAAKASPPPATGTTGKHSFCLNGTGLATTPCYDTKKAAEQARAGITTKVTTLQYCVEVTKGTPLNPNACFPTQDQAQALLTSIQKAGVFHQTQEFCVLSSANVNLGCFLTRDQADAQLQRFGQERLLQVIGTTARLEQRKVISTLAPGQPGYEAAALTCSTPDEQQTSACSFDALKKQDVWFPGRGATSQTKYHLGPVLITGDAIKKATAVYNTGGTNSVATGWEIDFTTTSAGAKTFQNVTTQLRGQQLAIAVDEVVISAPTVQGTISTNGVITGQFTKTDAQDLATQLNAGALPVNLKKQQVQTVSPTLGKQSLHQGLIAGVAGLVLLALYLLFYYRLLGLVAWAGMTIWAIFAIALVGIAGRTLGYSLTLAGIAGLVISLGVTADSYIVFFERLKDEVRHGKTPRAAVQPAFKRAYRTIVAADIITGLAAIVLYLTAISSVRGFALTLGVATLLDLFVVYFFKRPTVFLIARSERLVNLPGFGLTSGVAAEPLPGEAAPAIAGASR